MSGIFRLVRMRMCIFLCFVDLVWVVILVLMAWKVGVEESKFVLLVLLSRYGIVLSRKYAYTRKKENTCSLPSVPPSISQHLYLFLPPQKTVLLNPR